MPTCQGCNASFDDSFAFCPFCGSAKPETPKIKLEVDLTREKTPDDCPKCNNNSHTQKVSSIYAAGTSTGIGFTEGSGTSNHYQTFDGKRIGTSHSSNSSSSFSINQSHLAKFFDPPSQPKSGESEAPLIIIAVLALLLTCYLGFTIRTPSNLSDFASVLIVCGAWIIISILLTVIWSILTSSKRSQQNEEFQQEKQEYKKARYVWDRLYYCHKHDIVFMEGHDEFFPGKKALEACYVLGNRLKIIEKSEDK